MPNLHFLRALNQRTEVLCSHISAISLCCHGEQLSCHPKTHKQWVRGIHLSPRLSKGYMSDPENKGSRTTGVNFDTLGSWNNRLALPILYEQSIITGKLIPRVPLDEIGLTSVIGRRKDNEDRSVVEELSPELLYFGIFDGHCGSYAAEYAADHLIDHLSFWLTKTTDLKSVLKNSFCDVHNLLARHLVFYHIDDDTFKTGTTATVCLLRNSTELVVGHVGDSIAILCRDGQPVRLSVDHDPEDCEESVRIIQNGGEIIHNSLGVAHVNGRLAMTRSLGDVELKSFGVTACPYLRTIEIKHGSDAYLVLSSDGLSHAINDQEIVNIATSCQTPQEACSRLADQAQHFGYPVMEGMVSGRRGRGRPTRQWAQDIKDTLDMKMHETGELASDHEAFWHVVMRATFCKEHAA